MGDLHRLHHQCSHLEAHPVFYVYFQSSKKCNISCGDGELYLYEQSKLHKLQNYQNNVKYIWYSHPVSRLSLTVLERYCHVCTARIYREIMPWMSPRKHGLIISILPLSVLFDNLVIVSYGPLMVHEHHLKIRWISF